MISSVKKTSAKAVSAAVALYLKHTYDMQEDTNSVSSVAKKVKKVRTSEEKRRHCEQVKDYYRRNRDAIREKRKVRYSSNPDKIIKRSRAWVEANIEHAQEYQKRYRAKNKAKMAAYFSAHSKANREKINARNRINTAKRNATDLNFRLRKLLACRIQAAVRNQYGCKALRTMELIGCTVEHLRKHIETQFKPGMSWDNWAIDGWHIDHIRPCASFDLKDPIQQAECFNFKNLQPLWWLDNIRKSDSLSSSPAAC